jgi:hypothetical protein
VELVAVVVDLAVARAVRGLVVGLAGQVAELVVGVEELAVLVEGLRARVADLEDHILIDG